MRKLTVTREKSFVACLNKTKFYIEDDTSCDLVIRGVPCRYLGAIKNGGTETFEVTDKSVRVFAIVGKSSKEYCNDMYMLPEGDYDINLTGKHKYNSRVGHAFRFDNNENAEAVEFRVAAKKKGTIILTVAIIIGVIAGILIPNVVDMIQTNTPAEIEVNDLKITLNKNFDELDDSDGEATYATSDVSVFFLEDKLVDMGVHASSTVKEYARLSQIVNNVDAEIHENDGLVYFTYTKKIKNTEYKYTCFAYKEDDAFWVVQFCTKASKAEKYEEQIFEWAKSVKFDNDNFDL